MSIYTTLIKGNSYSNSVAIGALIVTMFNNYYVERGKFNIQYVNCHVLEGALLGIGVLIKTTAPEGERRTLNRINAVYLQLLFKNNLYYE